MTVCGSSSLTSLRCAHSFSASAPSRPPRAYASPLGPAFTRIFCVAVQASCGRLFHSAASCEGRCYFLFNEAISPMLGCHLLPFACERVLAVCLDDEGHGGSAFVERTGVCGGCHLVYDHFVERDATCAACDFVPQQRLGTALVAVGGAHVPLERAERERLRDLVTGRQRAYAPRHKPAEVHQTQCALAEWHVMVTNMALERVTHGLPAHRAHDVLCEACAFDDTQALLHKGLILQQQHAICRRLRGTRCVTLHFGLAPCSDV